MDPGLFELIAAGDAEDEVAVVVRLRDGAKIPGGLRLVAQFGLVATARVERGRIEIVRADPAVASLKAPRLYAPDLVETFEAPSQRRASDLRRPADLSPTGRGVAIAVLDWGCDFTHPDFRHPDGTTRLLALWDQRGSGVNRYGYGAIHGKTEIDRALGLADPLAALSYPIDTRPQHGTHVLGIAAGNGRAHGPEGVAPDADLIFCHLGSGDQDLGNSAELLEAVDFAVTAAGDRPLVINTSVGRHAGPHDNSILLQQAIDWLLGHRPGTAIAQSTGNYYASRCHMSGRLREGVTAELPFHFPRRTQGNATIEVWYPGSDDIFAGVTGPDGSRAEAARGSAATVRQADGTEVGTLYHRADEPNNGDNMVNLVLRPSAAPGEWVLALKGLDIADGRWHAWIERDTASPSSQPRFHKDAADPTGTTGSICNSLRTIAVGAHDAHRDGLPLAPFSSVGPTRDGRVKPLLTAPGVGILSCRSSPSSGAFPTYVRMSGTSMAAPHVAGTLALMLQVSGRQRIGALRRALFSTLDEAEPDNPREGYGRLDVAGAVAAARALPGASPLFPMIPDTRALTARMSAMFPENSFLPGSTADLGLLEQALDPGDDRMQVIGWGGRRLSVPLAQGDIVIDRTGRRPALVGVPEVMTLDLIQHTGLDPDSRSPGCYVRLLEPDGTLSQRARRIAAPTGLLIDDIAILRAHTAGSSRAALEFAETDPRPTIRVGSRGPAVVEAQEKLNRIHAGWVAKGPGIDRCPVDVDGAFGARTRAAVLSFQRRVFPTEAREWDGVVGPRTWALLDREDSGSIPTPPIVLQSAAIEIVAAPAGKLAADASSPVLTFVRFGLWDAAYDAIGDIRNGQAEADNFIGGDMRRFYLRVRDRNAPGGTITAQWRTTDSAGNDLDAPVVQDITLTETVPGSKIFTSRAILLVTDDTDARQETHSGLTTGNTGLRQRGQADHRLRRGSLDGSVVATYQPAGPFLPVQVALPLFRRNPDSRLRLSVRTIIYRSRLLGSPVPVAHAGAALVDRLFALSNDRWAQTGLRIDRQAVEIRDLPAAAQDVHGRYIGSFENDVHANARDAERAVLDDLLPGSADNTLTVIFAVSDNGTNGYAEFGTGTPRAIGERFFIFVNPLVAERNETLAHEFHHCIFNRFDAAVDDRFFAFNTLPPVSIARARGIALPDPRIYRRIPLRHAADPDSDARNDHIINWVKRRRTALEPALSGPVPAPTATTGNTFVRGF